jgi:hypothetical protein
MRSLNVAKWEGEDTWHAEALWVPQGHCCQHDETGQWASQMHSHCCTHVRSESTRGEGSGTRDSKALACGHHAMADTMHITPWRTQCTSRHGGHNALEHHAMADTMHITPWRTQCTPRHGGHNAHHAMADTMHTTPWRTQCTSRHTPCLCRLTISTPCTLPPGQHPRWPTRTPQRELGERLLLHHPPLLLTWWTPPTPHTLSPLRRE